MDDPTPNAGAPTQPRSTAGDVSAPAAGQLDRRDATLGVLGLILMGAGLAVMAVAALHAGGLDPDPAWNRVWLEETEPDPTPFSRLRHRLVAAGASVAVAVGWVIAARARPRAVVVTADVGAPRAWLGWLAALDAVVVVVAFVAMDSSLIAAGAVLAAGALAVGLVAWQELRRSGLDDRHAWMQAGGGAAIGPALYAVLVAALSEASLFGAVLLPLLPIAVVLGHAAWFARLRPRPPVQAVPAAPASPGPAEPGLVVLGALLILAAAVLAVWPVEEPPRPSEPHAPPSVPGPRPPVPEPAPTVTAHAAPAPTPDPDTVAADLPDCLPEHLVLTAGGFDSAMGKTAAAVTALNTGASTCALRGRPGVGIVQGGEPIELQLVPMSARTDALAPEDVMREPAGLGAAVAPGGRASATLLWPGYRALADATTPQIVTVTLAPGTSPLPVAIAIQDGPGGNPGPAPFDLQDGVPGGAELRVGPWAPRR